MNPEQQHQHEEQPEITAQNIAKKFANGEFTDIEEKTRFANETDQRWQNEGYYSARIYVDTNGEIMMCADVASALPQDPELKPDRKMRMLIDGQETDVTIPSALRGEETRFRSQQGWDYIYDIESTPKQDIPADLRALVERFGPELIESDEVDENTDRKQQTISSQNGLVGMDIPTITSLSNTIKQERFSNDETEAYKTEALAKRAAQELKIGMFVLPKARRALREQAYRDEINRRNTQNRQQ